MSSSHPYPSPNAPSSRLLAACHPEYRHERQQNEAEIVSDAAMLFNQNHCWLACEMRQTRETKHDRKGLHPSHPT